MLRSICVVLGSICYSEGVTGSGGPVVVDRLAWIRLFLSVCVIVCSAVFISSSAPRWILSLPVTSGRF